ncbi:winged helix-turn-helix domain-containing protein [Aquimarina sp. 2201CG5-10]|uniref:ArsR/SmtB family transcription factor n=1 Tax=Aquimarina callyspongiae TaxID=3098150 RepID=UPI002AB54726|nr:winged helix-turn-helix domain-containing protein [Aquimarina sp. 2201CG5-10]MDY8137185.1 winged helix-turn-helix domain-containing protein [Aquimarina sp. 2201CG5-10]
MHNLPENIEQHFGNIAVLIGEKSRAIMLWNLLDGRAYTANELATCAEISAQAASNHLSKLVKGQLLVVEKQGRHKYYRFANDKVALVIENIAGLLPVPDLKKDIIQQNPKGIQYARTCYDHLAGRAGVEITTAFINKGILVFDSNNYSVTPSGEQWFSDIGIQLKTVEQMKRKFAFPCLDWTERKHHLGGALGAVFFSTILEHDWIRKIQHSREVFITSKGATELRKRLDITL